MMRTAALASAVLFVSINASAITINPGPVGDSFNTQNYAFSDFNGFPLDGGPIQLTFAFADGKGLEIDLADNVTTESVSFDVSLFHDGSTDVRGFSDSATLNDAAGFPLYNLPFVDSETDPGVLLFGANTRADLINDGLIFYGLTLRIEMPFIDGGSAQITSGQLRISTEPGSGFNIVPEPASLALLGFGGLLIARRQRHS